MEPCEEFEKLWPASRYGIELQGRGREITPANRPRDADGNDRLIGNMHRRKLRIARAKQRLPRIVFPPASQNLSSAVQHDPSEPRPVLVIAVEEQCNGWVLSHVA